MSQSKNTIDIWTFPTLVLWVLFFMAGFFPEGAFWAARHAGKVVTQNAIINSPSLITVFLSLYLALFAYLRCIDAGISRENALARGIQIGILGLIAFLPYPFYLLLTPGSLTIPGSGLYRIDELIAVFGLPVAKMLAWLYLLALIFRSYLTKGLEIFVHMYPRLEQSNPEIDANEE